jgi:hypothetical protein
MHGYHRTSILLVFGLTINLLLLIGFPGGLGKPIERIDRYRSD